jgi:ATP-dependent Lon protease
MNWDFVRNVFKNHHEMQEKKINDYPKIGLVNGLYATNSGLGGLTIIQAKKTHSDKKFGLEKLTGSQGDVMKESMDCAFTVLNNILKEEVKDEFHKNNEKFGIHIHCPEAATPKDGPSAGLAITLCLISLVTKIPIKNDVAMTGEIDLEGNAHTIGGLYSKIQGALNAGAKLVLIPRLNDKDLMTIFSKEQDELNSLITNSNIKDKNMKIEPSTIIDENTRMFRNCVTIKLVDNIHDILKYALVEHTMEFNDEL